MFEKSKKITNTEHVPSIFHESSPVPYWKCNIKNHKWSSTKIGLYFVRGFEHGGMHSTSLFFKSDTSG